MIWYLSLGKAPKPNEIRFIKLLPCLKISPILKFLTDITVLDWIEAPDLVLMVVYHTPMMRVRKASQEYKMSIITHVAQHLRQPPYLAELIARCQVSWQLRSANQYTVISQSQTKTNFSDRCSNQALSTLWNDLPLRTDELSRRVNNGCVINYRLIDRLLIDWLIDWELRFTCLHGKRYRSAHAHNQFEMFGEFGHKLSLAFW
jgi:hypothetical protein